jgi:DNA-binding HxlR family transcriptional regulator
MNEHSGCPTAVEGRDHHGGAISAFCPNYHRAVELIGRRWTGAILRVLLSGATRFSDVTAAIPGLSDRLLSERLKELEFEGIVTRTVIPATPVRIVYRLTEKGHALNDVMLAISAWAETWLTPATEPADCSAAAEPVMAMAGSER